MATIRGLVTKMPGIQFSGLNTVFLFSNGLVSMDDYQNFINFMYATYPDAEDNFNENKGQYQFKDNIPKGQLFVRLTPGITSTQRDFITNGIRNYFLDQSSYIMVKADYVEGFTAITKIFNIFVGLIAAIALFIAFFLLLLASTQNINDAVWEYGVLRSMGLTKREGLRIYIYEAYIVVISAAILGTFVGFLTATAVAVQFYSFIELPVSIEFPWVLFGCMIGLSLVTVAAAVLAPVNQVNKR